jgi:hypothetical protein
MTGTIGPFDAAGNPPALQQTRIAAFLISAHAAEARLLAAALAARTFGRTFGALEVEVNAQLCREGEIVSLLTGATAWCVDPALAWLAWRWELAWLPQHVPGVGGEALAVDAAAFGYALHTVLRPAVLLPADAPAAHPFVLALRRIEIESGRLVQAQLRFLKGAELAPARTAIAAAVERRHQTFRELWRELLAGLGISAPS